MPEPLLYLRAMAAAATVSLLCMLAMAGLRRTWSRKNERYAPRLDASWGVAIGLGLLAGNYVLSLRLAWPPANGLDRLFTIVLPLALGAELVAGCPKTPRSFAWLLRGGLAVATPRVLLHASVYLNGREPDGTWRPLSAVASLAVLGALLAGVWGMLYRLARRAPGVSLPLALGMAIQCTGLTIMMAGYIKGGAAAFPLAATVVGATLGARLISKRGSEADCLTSPVVVGIGVVGLFGLLMIGCFFGRLSIGRAVVILLAPLLCWVTEAPPLGRLKSPPWLVGSLRLLAVAIALAVVLVGAKRDFDRDMMPLLGTGLGPAHQLLSNSHSSHHAPP